jgi:chromosomal replication initiation ATPase DnaA
MKLYYKMKALIYLISNYMHNPQNKEYIKDIIVLEVCRYYSIPFERVVQRRRFRELVEKRHLIAWLLRSIKDETSTNENDNMFSLFDIRDILEYQNHATIIHGIKTIENLIETDKNKRSEFLEIQMKVNKLIN